MADEHYNAIVIGTSQGGRFLPVELAKAGQKVALVERDRLGGVCVNKGVHADQDNGRQRAPRLPGAARRGVRRAYWSGIGGTGGGARAQAGHGRWRAAELRKPPGAGRA
jgi:choline dehydrogenase-like flavoprotein